MARIENVIAKKKKKKSLNNIRIHVSTLYHMILQLYLVTRESKTSHVVLDTKWLSYHIIGPTFAGIEFKDRYKLLPENPCYAEEELAAYYGGVADFQTLKALLQSLELMIPLGDNKFTIPAKLAPLEEKPACQLKYGRCVICEEKNMFAPIVFPAIQARIFHKLKLEGNPTLFRSDTVEFDVDGVKGFVWKSEKSDAICVGVENADNPTSCQNILNRIQQLIILALNELSQGTNHKKGKLMCLAYMSQLVNLKYL